VLGIAATPMFGYPTKSSCEEKPMDNRIKFAALAAMLCCSAANAGDQQRPAAAGRGTGGAVLPEFSTLDANGDGVISQEEARTQASLAAIFADVDSNNNGKLDSREYAEARNRLEE
jgi:EF hand